MKISDEKLKIERERLKSISQFENKYDEYIIIKESK